MTGDPVPSDFVVVLTTVADDERADSLARQLINERLAACVNLHPAMRSVYRWKGQIETEAERQLVIKTTRACVPALEARLRELHTYELPEFLVLPVLEGSHDYLTWVREQTGQPEGDGPP